MVVAKATKQDGHPPLQALFPLMWSTEFNKSFDMVNQIYKNYFDPNQLPARTCIGVTGLAVGALVEVDLIAALQKRKGTVNECEIPKVGAMKWTIFYDN